MKPCTEDICSFNNEDKEIILNAEEYQIERHVLESACSSHHNFIIIDKHWLHRYTEKNNLSYRKITHICPKSPMEIQNDVLLFCQEVHELRRREDIPSDLIINFDETAIFLDQLSAYSYEKIGAKHPAIKVSKMNKKRLTAGLGITTSWREAESEAESDTSSTPLQILCFNLFIGNISN